VSSGANARVLNQNDYIIDSPDECHQGSQKTAKGGAVAYGEGG
jgi:hypothetical protein